MEHQRDEAFVVMPGVPRGVIHCIEAIEPIAIDNGENTVGPFCGTLLKVVVRDNCFGQSEDCLFRS